LIALCSFASRVCTANMLTPTSGNFEVTETLFVITPRHSDISRGFLPSRAWHRANAS